jgi:hypothetical protein
VDQIGIDRQYSADDVSSLEPDTYFKDSYVRTSHAAVPQEDEYV